MNVMIWRAFFRALAVALIDMNGKLADALADRLNGGADWRACHRALGRYADARRNSRSAKRFEQPIIRRCEA